MGKAGTIVIVKVRRRTSVFVSVVCLSCLAVYLPMLPCCASVCSASVCALLLLLLVCCDYTCVLLRVPVLSQFLWPTACP